MSVLTLAGRRWRAARRRAARRANLNDFRQLLTEHGIDTADLTDDQLAGALHEAWGMYLNGVDRDTVASVVVGTMRRQAQRQGGHG